MNLKSLLKSPTLGVAMAALALLPTSALASRFYSAAACYVEQDFDEDYFWNGGIANNSNGLGARSRKIICPLIDDNSISNTAGAKVSSRTSITQIFVDGFDANNDPDIFVGNAQAQVCIAQFSGTGVSCSGLTSLSPGSPTFTGAFDMPLDNDDMNVLHSGSSLDYAFLQLFIPRKGVFGASSIRGYQTF